MAVWTIDQSSAVAIPETIERKGVHPVRHQFHTTKTHYESLPRMMPRGSPMVSPEVMTNLGLQVKIHKNQRQADSRHNPQHKANEIMLVFHLGITGIMTNLDKLDSMSNKIRYILHFTLPHHLHSLQVLICLVTPSCN